MRLRTLLLMLGAATALWGYPRSKPGEYGTTPRLRRHFVILGDVRPPHVIEVWARPTHRERAVLVRAIAAEDPASAPCDAAGIAATRTTSTGPDPGDPITTCRSGSPRPGWSSPPGA